MSERISESLALAAETRDQEKGLTAFFIFEEANRRGHVELVRQSIIEKGFEVLAHIEIAGELKAPFSRWLEHRDQAVRTRDIATILIAYDLMPIPPEPKGGTAPRSDNQRSDIAIRAAANEVGRLGGRRYTPVTATATSAEAWSLAAALSPERGPGLRRQIQTRKAAFTTPPPLRELSSVACRAKVELVAHEGGVAVRKTFRPGAERYLERELEVLKELGPHCEAIPKLLGHGASHLLMEYIDESEQLGLPRREGLLPLRLIRQLAEFVTTCVAYGFDPVDLKPDGNAIFTRHGLKVIDYEFWRRCSPNIRPEHSFCLAGLPEDDRGDRPMGLSAPFSPYPSKWAPFTGLPVRSFLYDPLWLQRVKRLGWPPVAIVRRVGRFAARRVAAVRTGQRSA